MNHIVTLYKNETFITRKEFKSWDEAKMYLEECDKLSSPWTVWYQRKPL